jgi:ubiquinone/menaquinone biosynthesis C-methylase UbiE
MPRRSDAEAQKRLDIEYHRHAAATYDDVVTRRFHFFHVHSLHAWIRKLLQRFPQADVLDVGTGTGVVACTLAHFGCRVTAIDHSPEMLARARMHAESMGISNRVRFHVGDGERLPYPDATFHAVTIQGVLHHLSDIRPAMREAVRVLRDGGELYVSEPCIERTLLGTIANNLGLPVRWIKNLVLPSREAPVVSEHEAPISGPELVATAQSMGLRTEVEYLVDIGVVRFLPEPWRIGPTLLLSWPTRRRHGDLVFLVAHKQA